MDHIHILQLRVEHQSSARHCDRGIARFTRSADYASVSQVTLALAAIAFLALFLPSFSTASSQNSSATLTARLLAVVGGIFTSKTALFVLSNVIFVLLAADCRCCFATATTTTTTTTSTAASDVAYPGEPAGGVVEKREARRHQVHVESCGPLPCSQSLDDHNEQEGEDESTMSANTLPDEEQEQLPKLELVRLGDGEEDSVTVVDAEEPTCETAQGLDSLEISELNKKFDEFIRSRRIKWVKEEAYLLLCEV